MEVTSKRREAFCQEFAKSNDGETAAMMAGFSLYNLDSTASRLLSIYGVRQRILELGGTLPPEEEYKESRANTRKRAMTLWMRIAEFDPRRVFDMNGKMLPLHRMDFETASCIQSFETKTDKDGNETTTFKFHDRLAAINSVARVLGMFQDNVTFSGEVKLEKMSDDDLQNVVKEQLQLLRASGVDIKID